MSRSRLCGGEIVTVSVLCSTTAGVTVRTHALHLLRGHPAPHRNLQLESSSAVVHVNVVADNQPCMYFVCKFENTGCNSCDILLSGSRSAAYSPPSEPSDLTAVASQQNGASKLPSCPSSRRDCACCFLKHNFCQRRQPGCHRSDVPAILPGTCGFSQTIFKVIVTVMQRF